MKSIDNQKTRHLVTLAKEGNQPALNQLCSVYGERVRRIIRFRLDRKLRPKLDSADVVQDALIMALGGLKDFTYRSEGDFLRWLSRIAENKLHDIFDKFHTDKRDIRREVRLDNYRPATGAGFVGTPGPIEATTPSVIMSKKEDLDKLEKAIDELKPEYREVIVLTKIEGLSYKEIGKRLSKSPDAIRMLVPSAMAELTTVFMRI